MGTVAAIGHMLEIHFINEIKVVPTNSNFSYEMTIEEICRKNV